LREPETGALKAAIDWHLENIRDDRSLKERLEGMATAERFKALWWYWAPRLYARNRVLFRPFIQQLHSQHYVDPTDRRRWQRIDWRDEVAASLDPWIAELEGQGELGLFRRLYAWKHRPHNGWGIDPQPWRKDVQERFAASSPARRSRVLQLYDMHGLLDEPTALRLYEIDRGLAAPFILRHLPNRGWSRQSRPERWRRLAQRALEANDESFYFGLYRRQVALEEWIEEALKLCASIPDSAELLAALEKRHPQDRWGSSLGPYWARLLEARGLDVVPYLRKHLKGVFAGRRDSGYEELVRLARRHGWIDLWATLVVTCGKMEHYNAAIKEVLENWKLEEPERLRRLALFAGVSTEWNGIGWGLARVQPLSEANALAVYERYPQLLRQAFKAHVTPAWRDSYLGLFEAAWANEDEELADYLASRYVTRRAAGPKAQRVASDIAADRYVALKLDAAAFARRAANVLTRIPAYAIHDYDRLIRENRLARLLFERSLRSFLELPDAVRDLVEGAEIHVQHLAYRILAQADARAATLASENLEILIGTLLRPLHRRTRLAAFAALANAAKRIEDAGWILGKAREAWVLPDHRYPKEQLVGLIGTILARHPELARAGERHVIYRRAAPLGA
jgi:hypothetical protein